MADDGCIFCEIVAGRAPSHPVYEDEAVVAFLNLHPAAPGHTLVVPRGHAEQLWDLSEPAAAALGTALQRVSQMLEQKLRPDGMTVFQANRAAGWQSVFHVHFHVVPRQQGDGLVQPWMEQETDADQLAAMAARLGEPRRR